MFQAIPGLLRVPSGGSAPPPSVTTGASIRRRVNWGRETMQPILLNESNASRRVVYVWSVLSNGTTPAANEAGGQPTMSVGGLPAWNSAGTLRALNASAGEYFVVLGTSDVSVLGPGVLRYSSGSALETSTAMQIVGFDPYDGAKLGLTSVSTFDASVLSVGLKAVTHSGATVAGLVSDVSIRGGSYSSVTIAGVTRVNSSVTIADANYSGVTVRVGGGALSSPVTLAAGNYSDVTVRISGGALTSPVTLAAGRYSNVTVGGVERVESTVTIADADYSAVTVRASNVTIATSGIVAASFGAGAIDAVALATDAGQEIADRLIARNIAGGSDSGRTVGEALAALRNHVRIDGSVLTVYKADDTTAFWTASIATNSANSGIVNRIDPA